MARPKVSLILTLNAMVFGGIGLFALIFPLALANLVGLATIRSAAVTDLRATYGGFEIGLAIFFVLCARSFDDRQQRTALLAACLSLTGFVVARLFGLMIDGKPEPITYLILTAELTGSVLNWMTFWKGKGQAT